MVKPARSPSNRHVLVRTIVLVQDLGAHGVVGVHGQKHPTHVPFLHVTELWLETRATIWPVMPTCMRLLGPAIMQLPIAIGTAMVILKTANRAGDHLPPPVHQNQPETPPNGMRPAMWVVPPITVVRTINVV